MRDYADQINSLRLCAESDDPVDECCWENCNQHHGRRDNMCRQKIMVDAADAIEELLAAVPKWISAKKPPEKPNYYWCNVENIAFPGRYYQEKLWYDSEYFVNADGIVILRVTHYMPLPDPPKEDKP